MYRALKFLGILYSVSFSSNTHIYSVFCFIVTEIKTAYAISLCVAFFVVMRIHILNEDAETQFFFFLRQYNQNVRLLKNCHKYEYS